MLLKISVQEPLHNAAKAMVMTAIDLISDKALLAAVKAEFAAAIGEGRAWPP